jgi:nitroimidazol reductase NimA-like FMN-containing flavoprotein (pyridoxamine 5'-phosphate oxidase superfamily)
MRREDRRIGDVGEVVAVVGSSDVCRIALCDGDTPYIVPMNFGYEYADGALTLYFHCAVEGRKLDLIRRNPKACFEMDGGHELVSGEEACAFTMEYESVIGSGVISICEEREDKIYALKKIMEKYAPGRDFDYPDKALAMICTLKLEVSEFSGKRLKR